MTREEIVEGLKLLEDNMVHFDELQNDKGEWIDVHELIFEAIQSLSQEPNGYVNIAKDLIEDEEDSIFYQEPCDDAISREKVMGLVAREHSEWDDLYIDIAKLPSVMQKSGKWMLNKEKSHFFDVYECSNCGKISGLTNYCPNCGARMIESEEQTE